MCTPSEITADPEIHGTISPNTPGLPVPFPMLSFPQGLSLLLFTSALPRPPCPHWPPSRTLLASVLSVYSVFPRILIRGFHGKDSVVSSRHSLYGADKVVLNKVGRTDSGRWAGKTNGNGAEH